MDLNTFGFQQYAESFPEMKGFSRDSIARVVIENKNNYKLCGEHGLVLGAVSGKFLHEAKQTGSLPKVGDWVVMQTVPDEKKAIISSVLPRKSIIARKGVEGNYQEQVIATNVDILFIVQSLDTNFNVRRIERYLLMAQEGGCNAAIILNKVDAAEKADSMIAEIKKLSSRTSLFIVSAKTGLGMNELQNFITSGMTVAFVGSSGVGKSTLINALAGNNAQLTAEVRAIDGKGRHTTTKREIIILPSGGIVIDTPGMRELDVLASEASLDTVFADIEQLATRCKFNDCDHEHSEGCAIVAAVKNGQLDTKRYQSFIKLKQNLAFQSAKANESELVEKKKSQSSKKIFKKKNKKQSNVVWE